LGVNGTILNHEGSRRIRGTQLFGFAPGRES
jgi:hypothetical protein